MKNLLFALYGLGLLRSNPFFTFTYFAASLFALILHINKKDKLSYYCFIPLFIGIYSLSASLLNPSPLSTADFTYFFSFAFYSLVSLLIYPEIKKDNASFLRFYVFTALFVSTFGILIELSILPLPGLLSQLLQVLTKRSIDDITLVNIVQA